MFELCCICSSSCLTPSLWKTPAFSTLPSFWDAINTAPLCPAGLGSPPFWDLLCWTLSALSPSCPASPFSPGFTASLLDNPKAESRCIGVLWMDSGCLSCQAQAQIYGNSGSDHTSLKGVGLSWAMTFTKLQNGLWNFVWCGYTGTWMVFPGLMSLVVLKVLWALQSIL